MQFLSVSGPVGYRKGIKHKQFLLWIITKLSFFIIHHSIQRSQKPYEIMWCIPEKFPENCL